MGDPLFHDRLPARLSDSAPVRRKLVATPLSRLFFLLFPDRMITHTVDRTTVTLLFSRRGTEWIPGTSLPDTTSVKTTHAREWCIFTTLVSERQRRPSKHCALPEKKDLPAWMQASQDLAGEGVRSRALADTSEAIVEESSLLLFSLTARECRHAHTSAGRASPHT